MLRILATRAWLGFLALAILYAVAAFYLGQWQWGRYEEKSVRADRIESHYDAPPAALTSLDPPLDTTAMPRTREWTRVTVTGTYDAAAPLLVRNRPLDGTFGYEVLTVLRAPGIQAPLLVDRGWVKNASAADVLPDVPPTPAGEVEVTGWLRPGEPSLGRTEVTGQLASINVAEASQQAGTPLLGGFLVLEVERDPDGNAPPRPTPLERPDTDLGPNQAYAFQWWGSMPVGLVLVFFGVRRELREAQEAAAGPVAAVPAAGAPPREPVPARARKVRIWDEEDDD